MFLLSALLTVVCGVFCVHWLAAVIEPAAGTPLVWLRFLFLLYAAIALTGVALFGTGMILSLWRLLRFRRPLFELSPEGVHDGATGVSLGFVPWEQVAGAGFASVGGQRFLTFRVRNTRTLMRRMNPVKRYLVRVNHRYYTGAPINLPLNDLAVSERELAVEVARRMGLSKEEREEFLSYARPDGSGGRDETLARAALRIFASVVRWIVVFVLSIFYYVTFGLLLLGGAAYSWNGIGPGDAADLDYPVAGVVLLAAGVLVFIYFPRLVKKLTRREVLLARW